MGGLREILGCATASVPIALIAALIGEPKFAVVIAIMTPLSGVIMPLQGFIKERESGILPALLSSPLTAAELVLGKMVGFFLIGLILFWTMNLGLVAGLEAGWILAEAPAVGGFKIATLLVLAFALMSVLGVTVSATVAICWHVKTTQSAIFWSFLSTGVALVMASFFKIPLHGGSLWTLLTGFVLGALTAALAVLHAARLTPEPVLFRWVKKRSRKRRGGGMGQRGRKARAW
jgi:ABC-type Na+ efflux pump permease subunit